MRVDVASLYWRLSSMCTNPGVSSGSGVVPTHHSQSLAAEHSRHSKVIWLKNTDLAGWNENDTPEPNNNKLTLKNISWHRNHAQD